MLSINEYINEGSSKVTSISHYDNWDDEKLVNSIKTRVERVYKALESEDKIDWGITSELDVIRPMMQQMWKRDWRK